VRRPNCDFDDEARRRRRAFCYLTAVQGFLLHGHLPDFARSTGTYRDPGIAGVSLDRSVGNGAIK
jgi:hypothetical protein